MINSSSFIEYEYKQFLLYQKLFGRINHYRLLNDDGLYDWKAFYKLKILFILYKWWRINQLFTSHHITFWAESFQWRLPNNRHWIKLLSFDCITSSRPWKLCLPLVFINILSIILWLILLSLCVFNDSQYFSAWYLLKSHTYLISMRDLLLDTRH